MRTIGIALAVLLSVLTLPSFAQSSDTPDYEPPVLNTHVAEYRDKRRVILEAIERMNAPISERLAAYDREIGKLRDAFRAIRRTEYEAVDAERTVEHSCTKGSSGGVKDCGWKCTVSPSEDVHPIASTIWVKDTNKGTRIDGGAACLKMTRASQGRNWGRLHVKYRFKSDVLERRLNDDTKRLFDIIGSQG